MALTKAQAISIISQIQDSALDLSPIVAQMPRGHSAVEEWENSVFKHGAEFGAMGALMLAFDITPQDLGWTTEDFALQKTFESLWEQGDRYHAKPPE